MEGIFINADEPIEIRKAKSFLRKASYNTRKLGETVFFKHNQVTINDTVYTTSDYEKIPAKYLATLNDNDPMEMGTNDQEPGAVGGKSDTVASDELGAVGGEPIPVSKDDLIRKGECMKITRKGLCFSGPSAYISNMAFYEIVFKDRTFKSNEQGIQWTKAMDHNDPELAAEIKNTKDSYDVKSAGGIIMTTKEWDDSCPSFLEKMFKLKLEQHPELLERLIETYPLELIEASIDTTYGGGAAFHSPVYDSDNPLPGNNVFGKVATKY